MRHVLMLFYYGVLVLNCINVHAQTIKIGILVTDGQRTPYEEIFKKFTKETGIRIQNVPRQDVEYKRDLPIWLIQGTDTPDVIYWQASQRLFFYAAQGLVHPISSLWGAENLDKTLAQVKSGVTYKGEVFALPLHYYSWGIYYKKSVIERFGGVPQNWEQFVQTCERIKHAGIIPIGLGAKNYWPVAGWFDYIDLRLNGLDFHLKLLSGEISFSDARVRHVLSEWKRLIDAKFFNASNEHIDWEEVVPYMYRDQMAFTLIGNFVKTKIANSMIDSIGFMPFPKMSNQPNFEEAPMDVLLIPAKAKNISDAETFLRFMARPENQSALAKSLSYFPANKQGTIHSGPMVDDEFGVLRRAVGVSQFFDRDTVPDFEKKALPILTDFANTGDIDSTITKLEKARKDSF